MTTLIARFRQERPEPPETAEKFAANLFARSIPVASKVLPGMLRTETERACPNCLGPVEMQHGDRIRCSCGLYAELYGNCLTVWWEDKG